LLPEIDSLNNELSVSVRDILGIESSDRVGVISALEAQISSQYQLLAIISKRKGSTVVLAQKGD